MQIFVCTPLTLLPIGTLSPHRPDPSRTSALLTEPGYLLLYWYIISRVFLSFMFLSFQCTGVAGACMYVEHNAIMAVLVQRSCLCRGFVTTDLYLSRMKNQRGHWVCWMSTSTSRNNGFLCEEHTQGPPGNLTPPEVPIHQRSRVSTRRPH